VAGWLAGLMSVVYVAWQRDVIKSRDYQTLPGVLPADTLMP